MNDQCSVNVTSLTDFSPSNESCGEQPGEAEPVKRDLCGAEWSGVERVKRMKRSGAERSGAERNGAEWSGVERSGAEWSGDERRRAETNGDALSERTFSFLS